MSYETLVAALPAWLIIKWLASSFLTKKLIEYAEPTVNDIFCICANEDDVGVIFIEPNVPSGVTWFPDTYVILLFRN